jgi:hypothetical protein
MIILARTKFITFASILVLSQRLRRSVVLCANFTSLVPFLEAVLVLLALMMVCASTERCAKSIFLPPSLIARFSVIVILSCNRQQWLQRGNMLGKMMCHSFASDDVIWRIVVRDEVLRSQRAKPTTHLLLTHDV